MNRDTVLLILSAIIVFGFGMVVVGWFVYPPKVESTMFGTLLGTLGSGYLIVLNYWFNKKDPS
jgi:hypothetical protein